jgi:hypothetical protein
MIKQRDLLVSSMMPASRDSATSQKGRKIKVKAIENVETAVLPVSPSTHIPVLHLKRNRNLAEEEKQTATSAAKPVEKKPDSEKRKKKTKVELSESVKSEAVNVESEKKKPQKKKKKTEVTATPSVGRKREEVKEEQEQEEERVEEEEETGEKRSVLRFVGTPDDNAVPLRGTPPEWLFKSWQGEQFMC